MSRVCDITGKRRLVGNNVSHSNRKTKKYQQPNLQWKRIWVPELGRHVRLRISTRALRTLRHKSLSAYLKEYGKSLSDFVR